jgi:hypothetical protein
VGQRSRLGHPPTCWLDDRYGPGYRSLGPSSRPYSPSCLEEKFCELRLDRILGSSLPCGCAAHTAFYRQNVSVFGPNGVHALPWHGLWLPTRAPPRQGGLLASGQPGWARFTRLGDAPPPVRPVGCPRSGSLPVSPPGARPPRTGAERLLYNPPGRAVSPVTTGAALFLPYSSYVLVRGFCEVASAYVTMASCLRWKGLPAWVQAGGRRKSVCPST